MPSSTRPIDRALEIAFDPATTGLAADDVQGAIDALHAIVDAVPPVDHADLVHRTGDETIAGLKTFADPLIVGMSLTLANLSSESPSIGWTPPDDQRGFGFYSGITEVARIYGNRIVVSGMFSTFGQTSMGDYFLRRGNDGGLKLGGSGEGNLIVTAPSNYGYSSMIEIINTNPSWVGLVLNAAPAQSAPLLALRGISSASATRDMANLHASWADATDATRKGRLALSALDWAGIREGLRVEADGTAARIGFLGAPAVARPTGDLAAALVALGLVASPTTVVPYRFGASGVITTGQKAPAHRVRVAGTAIRLDLTLGAGTATAAIVASTDDGATWPTTVGTVAVAGGLSASATFSTPLAAGTLLRAHYTAAGGTAADPVVSLYVAEGP